MNPFRLDPTGLMIWGLVAHLIADWPLQNDWMANGKAWPWTWSIAGLAPAFTHALIHMIALGIVFGYWPGAVLGFVHLAIDTRIPVAWWSKLVRQTQPRPVMMGLEEKVPMVDVGTEVRFWTDQVFHIVCVAVAALVIG